MEKVFGVFMGASENSFQANAKVCRFCRPFFVVAEYLRKYAIQIQPAGRIHWEQKGQNINLSGSNLDSLTLLCRFENTSLSSYAAQKT